MKPRIHRTHMIRSHQSPNTAISIDDFLTNEATKVTASELQEISQFSKRLVEKTLLPQARQHHDLHEGVQRMVKVLESGRPLSAADPLPADLAELTVAARYLLKGADIIPDWVPEIGLTDDARVIARLFERHPSLLEEEQ
ncbi:MAG: hypothetical protein Fur0032_12890 [Terrimicrobiaceae bacterium]